MVTDQKVWVGVNGKGERILLDPLYANRHGLVAGATGTGKTVTLKVLAESFSDMGIPVFMADVKGDIAGICEPGVDSEDMQKRITRFGLDKEGFSYQGYPVTFWDIYGEKGIPLRTTISEMGPLLLARLMNLNDLQTDILSIVFKIADDNNLLLIDTKDLKAMLNFVSDNNQELTAQYGKMSPTSIAAIVRAVVALEVAGGDKFFGEPDLNVADWFTLGAGGKGMINILDSESLISNTRLYSTFLLWLLSELFEELPEVGDLPKPKMVFFFDEAHLLFKDAPKVLLEKVEQVVKLVRSKGVGVYFCTQNPKDIPDAVLAQLSNKIQHGLRAYTPADQKAVKAAAQSFRINPEFDTYDTILNLGTGEAVVSFLGPKGIPGMAEKVYILPPKCLMGSISDAKRDQEIKGSILYTRYLKSYDSESAYEILEKFNEQQAEEAEAARREAEERKQQEKEEAERKKAEEREYKEKLKALEREEAAKKREEERAKKEAEKKEAQKEREKNKLISQMGSSVAGTLGREAGKEAGGKFGKIGKKVGGNLGAVLGRGLLQTLLKK